MRKILILIVLAASTLCFASELSIPTVFTDHMVLQLGQKVPVWGKAESGSKVEVEFAGQKLSDIADAKGCWRVDLSPLKASKQSKDMVITSGGNEIVVNDVLVGEVWLCSGQSNMQWSLRGTENADAAIAAADYPLIRLYDTPRVPSSKPLDKINAKWKVCSPSTADSFSAVAYYFGRKLHKDLDVPVGLLLSAWGGTRIEPWTPPYGFEGIESLADINAMVQKTLPTNPEYKVKYGEYLVKLRQWETEAAQAITKSEYVPDQPAVPSDIVLDGDHQTATKLYNGMIYAHVPFAIKGAIWYQGESNHTEGKLYTDKTKALLKGWRKLWGYDFPYYFVQIAPHEYGQEDPEILAEFWEAQADIVKTIPHTGMVVVSDYTTLNNIHPPNKVIPGERLALLAEANDYGMDVISTGPVFKKLEKRLGSLKVYFDAAEGLTTNNGKSPDWFEIAGKDRYFKKADAVIEGNVVKLSSSEVEQPLAVRFAWHKLATPNLVNKAGIPAATFRAGKLPLPKNPEISDIPEANGYNVIYQIDIPANASYGNNMPGYSVNNSGKPVDFSRVAYFFELIDKDGAEQYAFASMDKFTDDLKKIGIPVFASKAFFFQKVNNLTVRSNVPSVIACTDFDGGNIEFSPSNYGQGNSRNIPGASNDRYDFGDDSSGNSTGYGSMQVHNWKEKQTVFAVNHWGGSGTLDVGIGNSKSDRSDWTFDQNADRYQTIRLTVLVK